jgi:hypothetical protein
MFVDADPVLLDTTVLGAAVKVRATPVLFRWTFGDGAKLETADPGAPYPALRTAPHVLVPGATTGEPGDRIHRGVTRSEEGRGCRCREGLRSRARQWS